MTIEIRHTEFGLIIENPLSVEDANELLSRLPSIIEEYKLKQRKRAQASIAKAEERVAELRKYLESLQ